MLLEAGFQGVVNVRVNPSDDPYKLVLSSQDDIESILQRFFDNSPFPYQDQHKLRDLLKDVQLEICKMELAFMKRRRLMEKTELSEQLQLEPVEEIGEEIAGDSLRVKIDVPRTHEASLRFSGGSQVVSHNEGKLQEHLKEERGISFGLPATVPVGLRQQSVVQREQPISIETKELEEVEGGDVFGLKSAPVLLSRSNSGISEAIRSRQQTPGRVLKQRSIFDDAEQQGPEIKSGSEMTQWLQLMSSPRRNNADPFFTKN